MNWFDSLSSTLAQELTAALPSGVHTAQLFVRIPVAAMVGGAIGFDRELHHKSAGLRTHMLMAVGAALLQLAAEASGWDATAASRLVQGILAGIGFMGAGAIIKSASSDRVKGLTTAATLWLATILGVAVGIGRIGIGLFGAVLVLVILELVKGIERRMHGPKKDHAVPPDTTSQPK